MNTSYVIITAVLGLLGFWIAEKIIQMKKKDTPITCPIGYECDSVVRGPYSNFFGIPVVEVGRVYYLLVSAFFIINAFIPFPQDAIFVAVLTTGAAMMFSLYLTAIQLLVIKRWCSWCLMSALINVLLFTITFIGYSTGTIGFLFGHQDLLKWIFVASTLVGTLVTTLHSFIFVKFLKDFHISKPEFRRLGMYSHTAWVAIGFAFLSGLGIALTDTYREVTGNSEFLVMGIIVGILVAYEFIQNTYIAPRLINIHFGEHPKVDDHEHAYQRKLSFSFVAVGLMSWYLLMLFTHLSWHEYSPLFLVGLYVVVIIAAVLLSLVIEHTIYKKSVRAKDLEKMTR